MSLLSLNKRLLSSYSLFRCSWVIKASFELKSKSFIQSTRFLSSSSIVRKNGEQDHNNKNIDNNNNNNLNNKPRENITKPNLREAGKAHFYKARKVIVGVCLLVLAYMYPSIIKPLLGLDRSSDNIEKLEMDNSDLDKVLAVINRRQQTPMRDREK